MRAAAFLLAGGGLALALTGCFSAPPQIISLEPNRGSTGVSADAPVQVIFDRPVLHASLAGHFSVSPDIPGCNFSTVFTASPAAPCSIHWFDAQPGYELRHAGAVFAPSTRYTFTLAGGFTDPQGDRNGLDHHWDITTAAAPRLSATTPGDRASDVALDTPLAVAFSAAMDTASTAAAIALQPSVPGTTVVRNPLDHSRFAILPGQLLDPGIHYTVAVAATARGEDGQALAAPAAAHFDTGVRLEAAHAVVLAGAPGQGATQVLLPALASAAAGDPVAAPVLLRAPRCQAVAGCGPVAAGAPLLTYRSAAVAPDGMHLAVLIDDLTSGSALLEVIDAVNDAIVAEVPGGLRPSWSADGTQLALVSGGQVAVLDVGSRASTVIADGVTLTAPPLWAGPSTVVLSIADAAGAPLGVELVDRSVQARYSLPGSPPRATAVAASPAGRRLAVAIAGGGVLLVPSSGAPGTAERLGGRVTAIGFAGEGTLLAIDNGGASAALLRISVVGGDTTTVQLAGDAADLQTVRAAPDGRRLVFLGADGTGAMQAYVANADGSGQQVLTRFAAVGDVAAQGIAFGD